MNTTQIIVVAVALWLVIGALWTLMASRAFRSSIQFPFWTFLFICLCETIAWPIGMIGFYRIRRPRLPNGAALNFGRSSRR